MLLVTYFLLKVYSFRLYTLAYNPFQVNFCTQLFFFSFHTDILPFLPLNYPGTFTENQLIKHLWVISGLCPTDLYFHRYTSFTLSSLLQLCDKYGNHLGLSHSVFFFFFKNFLASPSSRLPLHFVNKVLLTYGNTCPLCIFYDCFWTTLVKMNSCNKDSGDWKA